MSSRALTLGQAWRRVWKRIVGESETEKYLKHITNKEYQDHLQYWQTCRRLHGEVLHFIQYTDQLTDHLTAKIQDAKKQQEEEAKQFDILKNIFSLQNLKQLGTSDGITRERLQKELQAQLKSVLPLSPDSSPSTPPSSSTSPSSSTPPFSSTNSPSATTHPSTLSSSTNAFPPEQQDIQLDTMASSKSGVAGWIDKAMGNMASEDLETITARFRASQRAFQKEEEAFWGQLPVQKLKEKLSHHIESATSPPSSGISLSLVQQLKERQALKDSGSSSANIPKIDLSSIPKETLEQLRKQHKERQTPKPGDNK